MDGPTSQNSDKVVDSSISLRNSVWSSFLVFGCQLARDSSSKLSLKTFGSLVTAFVGINGGNLEYIKNK